MAVGKHDPRKLRGKGKLYGGFLCAKGVSEVSPKNPGLGRAQKRAVSFTASPWDKARLRNDLEPSCLLVRNRARSAYRSDSSLCRVIATPRGPPVEPSNRTRSHAFRSSARPSPAAELAATQGPHIRQLDERTVRPKFVIQACYVGSSKDCCDESAPCYLSLQGHKESHRFQFRLRYFHCSGNPSRDWSRRRQPSERRISSSSLPGSTPPSTVFQIGSRQKSLSSQARL